MRSDIIYQNGDTRFQFVQSSYLPNIKISTPLNFPFIGNNLVLIYSKKRKWWDVPGGKLEPGETWQEALKREVLEEAGLVISNIIVIGYIEAVTSKGASYGETILPVTISFVDEIKKFKVNNEVLKRKIFRREEAVDAFTTRSDQGQFLEILKLAFTYLDSSIENVKFEYQSGPIIDTLPITQVMGLLSDAEGRICIVRDRNENFYSLPGGGCELDETPEEGMRREIIEETQITSFDLSLLGSFLVTYFIKGGYQHQFRQCRFAGIIKGEIEAYNPDKDNFEIAERDFIDITELKAKVPMMNVASYADLIQDFLKYKEKL